MTNSSNSLGKTLPYDDAAEKALLGAILLDTLAYDTASSFINSRDFYHRSHQIIFEAMTAYVSENYVKNLDLISIVDYLRSKNKLSSCGGASYLASLTENVSTTASVAQYSSIIKSLSLRRNLILSSQEFITRAFDQSNDIITLLDESEQSLNNLGSTNVGAKQASIHELVTATVSLTGAKMNSDLEENVVSNFEKIDQYTDGGFHPSDFIVVAARPSIGKTAFGLSLIKNMICNRSHNYKVAFFSLEMSGVQVCQRLLSSMSKISLKQIRQGDFKDDSSDVAFNRYLDAGATLSETNLKIFDTPNMRLSAIRNNAKRVKREDGLDIIFIDYIGLIDAETLPSVPRHEQVSFISRSLKALARELNVPVVCLCQVSRDAEGFSNEPQLSNLRDSGAIEQDADMVIFLHRNRKIDRESALLDSDGRHTIQPTKIIVAKQRNGETGEFYMGFKFPTVSFENLENYTPPLPESSENKRKKGSY